MTTVSAPPPRTTGPATTIHAVGDRFIDALEAAVDVRRLYPVGHPRSRDAATGLTIAARELATHGEGRPILVLRGSVYLGPDLLPGATLRHGELIDELVEVGVASIEINDEVEVDDAELLVAVVRGEQPTTSAFRALHLNQVEIAERGAGAGQNAAQQLIDLPLAYLRGVASALAVGEAIDGHTARVAAARLVRHVRANPDLAVLLTAAQIEGDELANKCVRVAILSARVARALDWSDDRVVELVTAALLYDVGMLSVPAEIRSSDGPLSEDDHARMEQHTVDGATILFSIADQVGDVPPYVALEHHRRPSDGSYVGRPDSWDQVPVAARIVGALDTYVAMTADRPYRAAERPDRALAVLRAGAPDRYDTVVVAAIHRVLGAYPIGCAVELNTREMGLVVAANPHLPTQPIVRVLRGPDGEECEPVLRDLSEFDGLSFPYEVSQVLPRGHLGLDVPTLLQAARRHG